MSGEPRLGQPFRLCVSEPRTLLCHGMRRVSPNRGHQEAELARARGAMAREEDIELLYDAVADPSRWEELLRRWLVRLGGDRIILFSTAKVDPAVRLYQYVGHDPAYLQRYWQNFAADDPWTRQADRFGVTRTGGTTIDEELVPADVLLRTAVFNECLRPEGIAHRAGAIIADGTDPALSPLRLTVHRNFRRPQFDVSVHRELAWIVRQVRRAAELREKMLRTEGERSTLLAVLDAIPGGAVVVTADGTVIYANRQGEALLRRGGLHARRRLHPTNPEEASRLSVMIAGAIGLGAEGLPVGGTLRITLSHDAPPLIATISPLPGHGGRLALVSLFDPAATATDLVQQLRSLFKLSTAEIRVVRALADGTTRAEIAGHLGISTETVATHVKRALVKTGTARQQQLLSLVAGLRR
jgi:DNA-binding CsgD family transcriptional regulator/PAS domain-containing protein